MILKYDLKRFFKDRGLNQSHFARKIGISRQLFSHHIHKGDLPMSYVSIISDEMKLKPEDLVKELNINYVKTKI